MGRRVGDTILRQGVSSASYYGDELWKPVYTRLVLVSLPLSPARVAERISKPTQGASATRSEQARTRRTGNQAMGGGWEWVA